MARQVSVQAVKRYDDPGYPTQDYLDVHPELLRLAPHRWQGTPAVVGMLAAAVLLQGAPGRAGAGARASARGIRTMGALGVPPVRTEARPRPRPKTPPHPPARVAPLFVHGAGFGEWGGLHGRGVAFLAEDEARKIIAEEAVKPGLHFRPDTVLHGVETPVTDRNPSPELRRPRTAKRTLVLDGADSVHHVYYEYVSVDDFNSWEGRRNTATAEVDDLKSAATVLQQGLVKANPPGTYAVFYDPMAGDPHGNLSFNEKALQEQSKQQLRLQVRDFLKWLRGQGVI